MTDREVVFVAYPSRDPNLAEMVMDASYTRKLVMG